MKKLATVSVACALLFLTVPVLPAQEPAPAPKPGPEHQKLAYYVGKWSAEGDIKASTAGPAGKYTYTETCDWLPGKFAILCKQDGNMMGGELHGTSIMSYDAMQNSYLYYATNNWGENSYYHGTVDGDTWTWLNEGKVNGQAVSARFVLKQVSPDLATFTFALAFGGQPLNNIMEGKQTRQK
jgi:hypothetical protein